MTYGNANHFYFVVQYGYFYHLMLLDSGAGEWSPDAIIYKNKRGA